MLANALIEGSSTPAVVSFAVKWSALDGETEHTTDIPGIGFHADWSKNAVLLEWSSSDEDGTGFRSYTPEEYAANGKSPGWSFSVAGTERNGIYY